MVLKEDPEGPGRRSSSGVLALLSGAGDLALQERSMPTSSGSGNVKVVGLTRKH